MTAKTNTLLLVILSLALAACGKDDKKVATQVAARVNGGEITVLQINNSLSRVPNVTAESAPTTRKQILNQLIDQELAVEQAIEKKMDRSPEVMTAIEVARREILARAYMQQVAAAQGKPSDDEVKTYYREHAELFEQRKVFSIEQIAMPQGAMPIQQLTELSSGKSMADIATELKRRDIKFTADAGVRPAEELPMELLPRLNALKDNQIGIVSLNGGVLVVHVVASRPAPVSEADAAPRIQQFLNNQKAMDAIKRDMQQLKDKAKIEYLGEFASSGGEKPAASIPAKADITPDSMAKGVAKLK